MQDSGRSRTDIEPTTWRENEGRTFNHDLVYRHFHFIDMMYWQVCACTEGDVAVVLAAGVRFDAFYCLQWCKWHEFVWETTNCCILMFITRCISMTCEYFRCCMYDFIFYFLAGQCGPFGGSRTDIEATS